MRPCVSVLVVALGVLGCGKPSDDRSRVEPAKPDAALIDPFTFHDGGGAYPLRSGVARVVDRGLQVSLSDGDLACAGRSATPAHTFSITIPVGPEALWVGHTIDVTASFRPRLDEPATYPRDRISMRVASIVDGRVRGRITVTTAASASDADAEDHGDGDFDVGLCDRAEVEALAQVPAKRSGPLAGTLLGRPFQLGRALIGRGGVGGLVLADDPTTTCAALAPSNKPSWARAPKGVAIQLRDFRASPTPRPAGGVILTTTAADDGRLAIVEDDLPVGFSLTLEGDLDQVGGTVRGALHGYSTKANRAMELGGTFEAEVCAW